MTSETSPATGGIAAGDLRVVRPADRVLDQASGGMRREAAVSRALVGAERIWLGYVELDPGDISAAHHHGEAESAIYLISGRARFLTDTGAHDAEPGDMVWVPPHVVHVEVNRSWSETVRMIVARSTQETLVFNLDMPDGWRARTVG